MRRVVFLTDCIVQDNFRQRFERGQEYDLSESAAAHWIRRGKAQDLGVERSTYGSLARMADLRERFKHHSALIVMGDAPCLFDDLSRAPEGDYDLMAVNGSGARYDGPISWWVTLHPEYFQEWKDQREVRGYPMDFGSICHQQMHDQADWILDPMIPSGSSTLLGVLAGLKIGYTRVVVAGAPMDIAEYHKYRKGWERSAEKLKGVVISMSGWTKEFLESL